MNQESLRIILKTYSKGGFNEDEAVQLIEDLYKNNNIIINNPPYYPWINPVVTYEEPKIQKFEVTCNTI